MTALVFKSGDACTDVTLPIFYRDPAASAGSIFCYDALDTYSWASQAAPAGATVWKDLLDIADASIAATPPGWSNGFVFDSARAADLITLPASSKRAAGETHFALAFWIKLASVAAVQRGILDLSDGTTATSQYALYRDTGNLVLRAGGAVSGPQAIAANTVYQVGISLEAASGAVTGKLWLNNAVVKTVAGVTPLVQPAKAACTIGNISAISANGDDFTLFRVHADACTTRTVDQFMAADYAAGAGRFA